MAVKSKREIKLRDVLFMVHAKPKDEEQEALWKRLIDGKLEIPDTWEVALSTGKNKKETWTRLINERKLGAMAMLRNLRNMQEVGVDKSIIAAGIDNMKTERVLPFRFISAAKYAPHLEDHLEKAMFKCLQEVDKLPGKTILMVDVSGSMIGTPVSQKSDIDRLDSACALAMLLREVCEEVEVFRFATGVEPMPNRRGFALAEVIKRNAGGGTDIGKAVQHAYNEGYDRLIVVTDEQSHTRVPDPKKGKNYMINVGNYQNGIGYGKWTHIDGWSEAIVGYIAEAERQNFED